jgi:hypothetical protein
VHDGWIVNKPVCGYHHGPSKDDQGHNEAAFNKCEMAVDADLQAISQTIRVDSGDWKPNNCSPSAQESSPTNDVDTRQTHPASRTPYYSTFTSIQNSALHGHIGETEKTFDVRLNLYERGTCHPSKYEFTISPRQKWYSGRWHFLILIALYLHASV